MAHKPTIAHNQPNIAAVIQQDGQAPHVPMLLVTHLQGQLVDVVDVQFAIFNSAGTVLIDPVAGRHDLDWASRFPSGDKLSVGRFAPSYTPDVAILAAAEYQVRYWFKYKTSGVEHSLNQQLLVVDESAAVDLEAQIFASSTGLYCTEVQVRDEGFSDTSRWKKTRIDRLIKKWSRRIERWTGRWFEPRVMVLYLDGTGDRVLEMPAPIISIEEVRIISRGVDSVTEEIVAAGDIQIYNRHISQGLIGVDDDREDPRIAFVHHSGSFRGGTEFPVGSHNIGIAGIFGYTDPNKASTVAVIQQYGETPADLTDAVVQLVVRDLTELIDWEDREDAQKRGQLKSEKHDGHKVEMYEDKRPAPLTGDPELDGQILQFRRPIGASFGGGLQFTIDRIPLDSFSSGGLVGVG